MADILEARNERLFDRVFLHNHIKRTTKIMAENTPPTTPLKNENPFLLRQSSGKELKRILNTLHDSILIGKVAK